jgi:iron complex transport system substrate-binding protein
VDQLSRRSFVIGGLGAAVLGLAGCSDGDKNEPLAAEKPTTRSIQTSKGPLQVPSDPQRVVCLDSGFSWPTLVSAGLMPVGLPTLVDSLVLPENLAKVTSVARVTNQTGEPNLEKIAALKPDLILAASGTSVDPLYDKLTAIAPTAVYTYEYPSEWARLDHDYADAVNRANQLDTVINTYKSAVDDLKAKHGKTIATQKWAVVTGSGGQVYAWGTRSSVGPVLGAAGAAFSAATGGAKDPFIQLSAEKLGTLNDATVILYGAGIDGTPYMETADLLKNPVFSQLPAAKAGHIYPLPSWFIYCYQDATAQLAAINSACEKLA